MPDPSSFSEAMTNAQDYYLRDIACGTRMSAPARSRSSIPAPMPIKPLPYGASVSAESLYREPFDGDRRCVW